MTKTGVYTALAAIGCMLMLGTPSLADDTCSTCGSVSADCSLGCEPDHGTSNYVEFGFLFRDLEGSEDSFNQYGHYPRDWMSSGRYNSSDMYCLRSRFEARWQDVSQDDGRMWSRLVLWPLTLESDSAIISGRAWDSFGTEPSLVPQQVAMDDLRLRIHHRDLESLALRYERFELDRKTPGMYGDLTVQRLGSTYNFELGRIDTRGQLRQTATVIDTKVPGASGSINHTNLKLDTQLTDDVSAYSRLGYSAYEYDNQPDSEFAGADWTLGMRYQPECDWEFRAEYRTRENPDDNIVSSHTQGFAEYGMAVGYYPGSGGTFEAGYKLRKVDYARLNMQDSTVFSLLRQPSALTPADVASAVNIFTPEMDIFWLDIKRNLSDELRFTTRVDYLEGDMPTSQLVSAGSPSLFFDKQLSRSHGLSYMVDDRNQLDLNIYGQESVNSDRDSSNDQSFAEGIWSYRVDSCSMFSLAYRNTESNFDIPGITAGDYTTDDKTYAATYGQDFEDTDYTLNVALSEGSGAQDYEQTSAGAGIHFKRLGPLGLRLDWYKRNYTNFPGFDSDDLTVAVDYRIKF